MQIFTRRPSCLAHGARRRKQIGQPLVGTIQDCRGDLASDFFSGQNFHDHAIEIDIFKLQHHRFLFLVIEKMRARAPHI
jgi:hypothetical protein